MQILPSDAAFGGATREEWEARSVQWGMSMPEGANAGSPPDTLRDWTVRAGFIFSSASDPTR